MRERKKRGGRKLKADYLVSESCLSEDEEERQGEEACF